ncbi:MAG TPA: magnesium/cobalt transporter CorA [Thermodesulfobacteriota bacterium]|nr:magnesium/cobalt transporter CorA [Thermodesulfobacteriota bacterium]
MAKLIEKRSRKTGLPPGTLVHIGEERAGQPLLTLIDYDEANHQETEVKSVEECFSFRDKPTVTWINVEGIHDVTVVEKLGNCFGLHPLVLEDILNTDQRPKMEVYGDYLYIVLKMLYDGDGNRPVEGEQVSLILGSNFVISFQEGKEGDVFNPVRERIRSGKGLLRKMGSDYLVYSLIDTIVDNYFLILERLGEKIELLEEHLVAYPTAPTLQEIQKFKNQMIFVRRMVWPLREVISGLGRKESTLVKETTEIYLRDVYDHVVQIMDTVEVYREMLSGMLDIYLSSVSNRLNSVMKVLTIIATIFMPLTFIAGIYGMNFKYMPELEWRWGYPAVWLMVVLIGISMLIYFKKKKWL